ncbi:hypothetical protein [Methylobacterium radiodurans]|nr:hypothetical protein [Methylobacterium radiodurans]
MHFLAISLGTLFCVGGAAAHFIETARRHEGTLGLAGLGFLLAGLFLGR